MNINLGTRGSRLALAQAEITKAALLASGSVENVNIRIIKTTGDQRLDLRLNDSGKSFEKGLFTKEIEQALLSGEIDLAVHSLKDLPTEPVENLVVAGVLPREDPLDVLVSKTDGGLDALPKGALIATGSPRRAQQITFRRPDLQVRDVRGNVPTRIEKLVRTPDWSAIILAKAGLRRLAIAIDQERLTLLDVTLFVTDLEEMLPAAGQGAIALQCRETDPVVLSLLSRINDLPSWNCVSAERDFLKLVGGGCSVPIGVHATVVSEKMTLAAIIFEETGKVLRAEVTIPFRSPQDAAKVLFQEIYAEDR